MPLYRLYLIASILVITELLTACGGGGGGSDDNNNSGDGAGGSSDQFSISTSSLDFVTDSPTTSVDPQTVTGTVNGDLSGTLYIRVNVTGEAVESVSNVNIDPATRKGTAVVYPTDASTLGEGTYAATITVRACLDDTTCATGELTGSPKTINVTYDVGSSVTEETVMPHVVESGSSGEVVIRGFDFVTDDINNVTFNSVDATDIEIVSESEIRATYPALTADAYAVQLRSTSEVTDFSGSLVVIDAPAFAADTVSYPTASPEVLKLVYDAEREALLVAVNYGGSRETNEVLRYQFSNGSFVSMTSATAPLLRGMDLSPDGSELIVIADRTVLHLNPSTLTETKSTDLDRAEEEYMKDVVVMNDGNALITTGFYGSGSTPIFIYPISQASFLSRTDVPQSYRPDLYYGSIGGSANGSYAALIEGNLSSPQPVLDYTALSGIFSETSINAKQVTERGACVCVQPVVGPTGQRFAIIDVTSTVRIYNRSYTLLGKLPITTRTVVFNSDGTRIYALDDTTLREYDLTATTDTDNNFAEVGGGTAISSPGSGPVRMILSADGGTLFIVGRGQIVIQPAP